MLIQPCPACDNATPRWLEDSSNISRVTYYHCDDCSHVWTTDKTTGAILDHVTPLIPAARRRSA